MRSLKKNKHKQRTVMKTQSMKQARMEKLNIPISNVAGCNEPVIFCGRN